MAIVWAGLFAGISRALIAYMPGYQDTRSAAAIAARIRADEERFPSEFPRPLADSRELIRGTLMAIGRWLALVSAIACGVYLGAWLISKDIEHSLKKEFPAVF